MHYHIITLLDSPCWAISTDQQCTHTPGRAGLGKDSRILQLQTKALPFPLVKWERERGRKSHQWSPVEPGISKNIPSHTWHHPALVDAVNKGQENQNAAIQAGSRRIWYSQYSVPISAGSAGETASKAHCATSQRPNHRIPEWLGLEGT